jgi:hypothetical protein
VREALSEREETEAGSACSEEVGASAAAAEVAVAVRFSSLAVPETLGRAEVVSGAVKEVVASVAFASMVVGSSRVETDSEDGTAPPVSVDPTLALIK